MMKQWRCCFSSVSLRFIAFAVVFSIVLNVCAVTRVSAASYTEYDVVNGGKLNLKQSFMLGRNMTKHEETYSTTGSGKIDTPDYKGTVSPSSFYIGDSAVRGSFALKLQSAVSSVAYTFTGRTTSSGWSYSTDHLHTVVKMYTAVNIKALDPNHLYSIRVDFTNAKETTEQC